MIVFGKNQVHLNRRRVTANSHQLSFLFDPAFGSPQVKKILTT